MLRRSGSPARRPARTPSVFRFLALFVMLALAAACSGPNVAALPTPLPADTSTTASAATQAPAARASISAPAATTAPAAKAAVTATAPDAAPAARLVRIEPAGKCRWVVYMHLTGFAPRSKITVTSDYDEVVCATGEVVNGAHWEDAYGKPTDANGRLMIDYLHESTGDYLYTFTDEQGNQASLPFHSDPEPTRTPRARVSAATATAPAPKRATATPAAAEPLAIVQAATLNLRDGPGQDYPIVGKASRGDTLYPLTQVGNCAWLQVGVLGLAEPAWVAGGPQFVKLNVPCATVRPADFVPPTPLPAPTQPPPPPAAVRPPTGLLSRTGPTGMGVLEVKNGTDGDGVVILVTAADAPVQAAYIRAGDSYRMTDIADGAYRLYFAKGDAWDPARKAFTANVSRQRFQDVLSFATTSGQYTGYEVTLYGVAGGNAATQGVPQDQFPTVP